jgi:S-formylglutathione hydrolase FrmB
MRKRLADETRAAEFARIFGDDPDKGENDVFNLAQGIDPDLLPAIRFDCGTEDGLLEENRDFHAHLESIGVPHEYAEFPGGHEWGYWDLRVQEALAFHARALGLGREPQ